MKMPVKAQTNLEGQDMLLWEFIKTCRHWRLPGVFRRQFTENDLLVTPEIFYNEFVKHVQKFSCNHMTPENASLGLPDDVERVLVLDPRGELSLVRQLRQSYPDKAVFSVMYDVAPAQVCGNFHFEKSKAPQASSRTHPPFLIVSLPGADAEFIIRTMAKAGMTPAREFVSACHGVYGEFAKHFKTLRVLAEGNRQTAEERAFAWHLQADVMISLAERGHLNLERLARTVERWGMKVIYLTRRDKVFHAGLLSALEQASYRSVWDVAPSDRHILKADKTPDHLPYRLMQDLIDLEIELEKWLKGLKDGFKIVALENFVEDPVLMLEEIGKHIEQTPNFSRPMPDYRQFFQNFPEFRDIGQRFKRDLIDRLGLHYTEQGSLRTPGEDLVY